MSNGQLPMPPSGQPPTPQPPQQYSPQTPQHPKKSGGKGKWVLLGIGILVIIIIIVAIASGGKKSEQKPAENKTNVSKPETPTTETKKDVYAIGETANVDNLAVTVYGFTWSTGGENVSEKAKPGRKFLVADVGFINNDSKPRMLAQVYQMKVHTPDGYDYEVSLDYFPEPNLTSDEIASGQTARGSVCFDVPENIGSCSIIFDTNMVGGDTFEVKLQ